MTLSHTSSPSARGRSNAFRIAALSTLLVACLAPSRSFAQAAPAAESAADSANPTPNANGRQRRGQAQADGANNNNNGGGRGNFSPEEAQQRMAAYLRTQFDVADDAEWKLISDRITVVSDLRRNSAPLGGGGFGGFRGGPGAAGAPGGGGNRGGRGATANPEQDSLRQALADKLPDAEIKSRLERLRESRKANEEKLNKAQEDLRAVLSVRQEAVAVMMGLLP